MNMAGWKRTRSYQESRTEDPDNPKIKNFKGWPAIIFPAYLKDGKPSIVADPEAYVFD